ncbi:MAG: hypothetical protein HYY08_02445 [Firmicutes bacterium]|nr:hypothetical protein [Bacillota bacterium]
MVSPAQGLSAWIMQRATGVVLVVVLGIHFWVLHYRDPMEIIVFEGVAVRLRTVLFMTVDVALLGLALYHGLGGLRNVFLDYRVGSNRSSLITGLLWLVGAVAFVYGVAALRAFASA